MQRDEALAKLRELKPRFPEMNIKRLALFGSTARDEARADSDVDLLVEFDKRPVGFIEMFRRQREIADFLHCSVDLVSREAVQRPYHIHILEEAIDV